MTQELVNIVMENEEVADKCLRQLMCNTLENLKLLNAQKIDRDIKNLNDGKDYNEIFNSQDINLEMFKWEQKLKLYMQVAKRGFYELYEGLSESFKDANLKEEQKSLFLCLFKELEVYALMVKRTIEGNDNILDLISGAGITNWYRIYLVLKSIENY